MLAGETLALEGAELGVPMGGVGVGFSSERGHRTRAAPGALSAFHKAGVTDRPARLSFLSS